MSTVLAGSCGIRGLYKFVSPNLEADERVGSESLGNGNVGGIAALRDQHATDSRNVVARIESVPAAADIGLEPASKISGGIRRRHADIPEVAGAIARGNVHAAAERDGKMRVVAANALAFIEDFRCRL